MTEHTDTAQEAEAEGVRPLSEDELAEMQRWVSGLTFVQGGMADRVERLLATLDAARAELERKEAEAAVLREALTDIENRYFAVLYPAEQMRNLAHVALNTTTAGAALLERVRQLEGQLASARKQQEVNYGHWQELKHQSGKLKKEIWRLGGQIDKDGNVVQQHQGQEVEK
jgi:predicted  nucleic acid-binding Zn-ribbon protein